jgi:hypothetical protein
LRLFCIYVGDAVAGLMIMQLCQAIQLQLHICKEGITIIECLMVTVHLLLRGRGAKIDELRCHNR